MHACGFGTGVVDGGVGCSDESTKCGFFFFFNTGNNVGYAVTADDKKIAIQITPPAINLYFMAFIHIFLILIFIFIL